MFRFEGLCFLSSPFYGRACRWAMLGELKPKGPKGWFMVEGSGFRVYGLGFRVYCSGFIVSDLGCRF